MDFTKYHVWFRYSSRWWWFQRFCYFMLFLPPKIGGNDPMTNWPSGSLEWYVNLFGVLSSALCLRFFAIWHYTTHFFCVTFRVKLESPNYDLQKVPVDDGLGFEDQLSDSGLVSFSTQEVQRSLPMSPGKSKSFFKGNSRRHTVYYMLNTVFFF